MSYLENALKMRPYMEKAAASLTDDDAANVPTMFPEWEAGQLYTVGFRACYEATLYKCLTEHTAQEAWTPAAAPSLWAKVLIPEPGAIPQWEQPGSTNPYMKGDKVSHKGKVWESDIDNNVWEPGIYGWTEVTNG